MNCLKFLDTSLIVIIASETGIKCLSVGGGEFSLFFTVINRNSHLITILLITTETPLSLVVERMMACDDFFTLILILAVNRYADVKICLMP